MNADLRRLKKSLVYTNEIVIKMVTNCRGNPPAWAGLPILRAVQPKAGGPPLQFPVYLELVRK